MLKWIYIFPIATFAKPLKNKIGGTFKKRLMRNFSKIVEQRGIKILVTFLKFSEHFFIELAQAKRH